MQSLAERCAQAFNKRHDHAVTKQVCSAADVGFTVTHIASAARAEIWLAGDADDFGHGCQEFKQAEARAAGDVDHFTAEGVWDGAGEQVGVNGVGDEREITSLQTVAEVRSALDANNYLASDGLATAVFLAMSLNRPLLLEGEAGVGKTELAKVLATIRNSELIRLQCYEGIDAAQAMYDWDYSRQLLHLRTVEATGEATKLGADKLENQLYSEKFLIRRALLRAIDQHDGTSPVLLIDEIDRADDEFEAYLLEVLSDFQITIPELGTYKATTPPLVVLTSNRTRDVHDALKRRCLYHWVEHPDFEREVEIVRRRVPQVAETLARQVAGAVETLRKMQLYKPPGVAETIDWATALGRLGVRELDESMVEATLGTVLKYHEDHERVRDNGVADLVKQAFERGLLNN